MVILLFLLFLFSHKVQSMEDTISIKSINETLSKDVDDLSVKIKFDTLQKSFEEIVETIIILKQKDIPIVSYLRDRIGFPQWKEDITLSHQPTKICAAGPLIAWCNQKKPNSFYFYKYHDDDHGLIKGEVDENIRCFDLSPKGSILAIAFSSSIILWDTFHNRALDKISFDPDTKSCITALSFFRNNKIVVGKSDGIVQTLCINKKKAVTVKITNNSLAIVARAPGGVTIAYDNEGNLKTYKRFTATKAHCKTISSLKSGSDSLFPVITIIPHGSQCLASDGKGAIRSFKTQDSSFFSDIKIEDAGTLIGLTAFDTFISRASTAQNIPTKLPVFRHYNFEGTLLDEVPMLESAQPIVHKSNTRKFVKQSNWLPKFLMHQVKKDTWILLIKQKDSVKQLAYKLMISQAFKEKNFLAVEALLEHPMIHSFGKYTQKLLKAIYREPKREQLKN